MKKNVFIMAAFSLCMAFMISCGGGKAKVETSPEMQEFMAMIKGTSSDVTQALSKFAVDELKNHDMAMYDLQKPIAVAIKPRYKIDPTVFIDNCSTDDPVNQNVSTNKGTAIINPPKVDSRPFIGALIFFTILIVN